MQCLPGGPSGPTGPPAPWIPAGPCVCPDAPVVPHSPSAPGDTTSLEGNGEAADPWYPVAPVWPGGLLGPENNQQFVVLLCCI